MKAQGLQVGRKRVARLMRCEGLVGVSRRRGVRTTIRDRQHRPAPDLVERRFVAEAPDRLWVAFVPTWAGFLYLAVVLDAFSRRIVGWAMSNDLKSRQVGRTVALEQAGNGVRHRDLPLKESRGSSGTRQRDSSNWAFLDREESALGSLEENHEEECPDDGAGIGRRHDPVHAGAY